MAEFAARFGRRALQERIMSRRDARATKGLHSKGECTGAYQEMRWLRDLVLAAKVLHALGVNLQQGRGG